MPRPGPAPILGRASSLALAFGALVIGCSASRAPSRAEVSAAPVDHSEYVAVDGAKLFLHVRGRDGRAPVLLWLHGGPGGAERPLFRYFNGALEESFVVVYWDQRGAGRSFDRHADPRALTIARHLADLDSVVDHVRSRFGREKVILVGHSWGSALGLLYARDHPGKVSSFVGVNQLVSTLASQEAQYEFVRDAASRRRDDRTLRRLREIGPSPFETSREVLGMEKLVARYGGVFHKRPGRLGIMVQGVFRGLVTPWEIPRFIRANDVSLEAMHGELLELDLARTVPRIDVPVAFCLGRHDRQTDSRLTASYFAALRAREKRLIWFEHSAHNVPFEEPELFNTTVVRTLQSLLSREFLI